jgi:two-component system phosphate regulon response regulator OmpR
MGNDAGSAGHRPESQFMTIKPKHILIVDDDPQIRAVLKRYLISEGFRVSEAKNGVDMRTAMSLGPVDLVLLDLMMPGEDGLTLARASRQNSAVPIIIMTGKGEVIDRVAGLEAGADDYIVKPFHLREVLARIRTVLRRIPDAESAAGASSASSEPREPGGDVVMFQGWRLDLLRRELHRPDGELVPLTTGEFDLLRAFVRSPNRVLSRDQLMDMVKGREWAAYDRTIDTQVVRLRRKIETDPGAPGLIKTVRGAGYIFATYVDE